MLVGPTGGRMIIVLVVDDTHDDELASVVARENIVPAEHFGGVWGAGQRHGNWTVGFVLIELGAGDDGIERQFVTDNIHRELLDAIRDVPHYVAIMPTEIAGDARPFNDIAPRFGGALIVECDKRSPQVERVRAERDD